MRLTGKLLGYGIVCACGAVRLGAKLVPESLKQRARFKAISLYLKMQGAE